MRDIWDVVVIGAGPAGLAAATTLAERGASVILFDENPGPGGQVYRGIEQTAGQPSLRSALGVDYAGGSALADRFRRSTAAASCSLSLRTTAPPSGLPAAAALLLLTAAPPSPRPAAVPVPPPPAIAFQAGAAAPYALV